MFYVKTTADGALLVYPYSLTDLRIQNKNTSWPEQVSDEVAAGFNVYPVTPAPQPAEDYTVNLERTAVKQGDTWVEQWIETPATPEQIAERTNAKAIDVRRQRNELLADSDWTQLPDTTVDKQAWAIYRQELRDVTAQAGFPWNVVWPQKPQTN